MVLPYLFQLVIQGNQIKPLLLRFAGELLRAFQGLYLGGVTTGKYIGTAHQKRTFGWQVKTKEKFNMVVPLPFQHLLEEFFQFFPIFVILTIKVKVYLKFQLQLRWEKNSTNTYK